MHGPQPSERSLFLIQPATKYVTDGGAVGEMARGAKWWALETPLHRKVVNTGRATAVVRSGHPIA